MANRDLSLNKIDLIFWVILIALILIGIIIFLVFRPPGPIDTPDSRPSVPCTGAINRVSDVTNTNQFEPCCNLNGVPNQRYYDKINDWTVVGLPPEDSPSAEQICIEFCDQLQLPSDCISKSLAYNNCIETLAPTNCTDPAQPAAKMGTRPFFVVGRGKNNCLPCSQT